MTRDKLDELLNKIKKMSPLPDDEEMTEELINEYVEVFEEIEEKYKDPRAIPVLIESLGIGEGYGVYQTVLSYLEHFNPEDLLPHLFKAVQHGPDGARKWGARLLGTLRDNRALPYLLPLLNDPEEEVRIESVIALEMIGDPAVIPGLQSTQKNDSSMRVRKYAGEALEALKNNS